MRTLLLDVDATVIVDVVDPVLSYAAYREGREYVSPAVPEGARELSVVDPGGRERAVIVRGEVVEAIRAQAAAGVDVVWLSSWLAAPELLDGLAAELGLDGVVRRPTAAELPVAPPADGWMLAAIVEFARGLGEGDDLVLASVELDLSALRVAVDVRRRAGVPGALLGGIPTHRQRGLDDAALRAWMPDRPHEGVWHRRDA